MAGALVWCLTIHSSRTRFAGRLNSGVRPLMKQVPLWILFFGSLVACAHRGPATCVPERYPLAASHGYAPSQITYLRHPPPEAAELLAMLGPADYAPFSDGQMRNVWYRSENGLLIYHVGTEIGGRWIGFYKSPGGWTKLDNNPSIICSS